MYNYQREKTQQRTIGITFVVVFHILLIWALLSGLARDVVKVIQHKVEVKLLEDPSPPPPPPPPPKKPEPQVKKLEIPKVEEYVPPPEVTPPATSTNAIAAIKSESVPSRATGRIDASGACRTAPAPQYPRKALQSEITGVVVARFKVSANGQFSEVVGMNFGSIPGNYRSEFQKEITQALLGYQCDVNLDDAVLEKEFAFNLE